MIEPAETTTDDLIRVQAGSYREALEKIHREVGAGFRIVHTRVVRREGLIGMVGGRGVEVFLVPSDQHAASPPSSTPKPAVRNGSSASEADRDLNQQIRRLLKERNQKAAPQAVSQAVSPATGGPPVHARILLEALEKARGERAAPTPESAARAPALSPAHPVLRAACRLLSANGFSPEIATELTNELRHKRLAAWQSTSGDEETESVREARRLLGEITRPKLPPCAPIALPAEEARNGQPRVVALVGPTGVGKTTTIAKLSAPLRLVHGRQIGLVTLDTFRLGAVEQISRYAEIVGLEVRSVERPEQLPKAISEFRHHDLVFVDTAGTSPKNADQLDHTHATLNPIDGIEIHLCLAASVTRDALLEAARRFRKLSYDRVLITKADEAVGAGQLIDVFQAARVPVSYITCGQDVPEDIATATTERVETLLFGERS